MLHLGDAIHKTSIMETFYTASINVLLLYTFQNYQLKNMAKKQCNSVEHSQCRIFSREELLFENVLHEYNVFIALQHYMIILSLKIIQLKYII